jgi:hypothetical protein
MVPMLYLVWCEGWDEAAGEPGGRMHDLGECSLWDATFRATEGLRCAGEGGWGPGVVAVTDGAGALVGLMHAA